MPAASVARTAKVCDPTGRSSYFFGDVHSAKAPPSKAHSNVPGSVALKVKSAEVLLVVPDGTTRDRGIGRCGVRSGLSSSALCSYVTRVENSVTP